MVARRAPAEHRTVRGRYILLFAVAPWAVALVFYFLRTHP